MDNMQAEITANTNDRHRHSNKELLDSYTVANSELQANTKARHEHANMSILEGITTTNAIENLGTVNISGTAANITGIGTINVQANGNLTFLESNVVGTLTSNGITFIYYSL